MFWKNKNQVGFFNFCIFFIFFLCSISKNAWKLEIAESILSMENIPGALSLCLLGILAFSSLFTFYLSQAIYIYIYIYIYIFIYIYIYIIYLSLKSFVDAAHQPHLCGVMSSSINLIHAEFYQRCFMVNVLTNTFYEIIVNCSQTKFLAIVLFLLVFFFCNFFAWPMFRLTH